MGLGGGLPEFVAWVTSLKRFSMKQEFRVQISYEATGSIHLLHIHTHTFFWKSQGTLTLKVLRSSAGEEFV